YLLRATRHLATTRIFFKTSYYPTGLRIDTVFLFLWPFEVRGPALVLLYVFAAYLLFSGVKLTCIATHNSSELEVFSKTDDLCYLTCERMQRPKINQNI
ncbi:hypothetical protein L9F63_018121, partial [Diploptera punctata]